MINKKRGKRKKRVCAFCAEKVDFVDYKDTAKLKKYISERNGIKLYPHKLDSSYTVFQGTSLACAYISGVCALLLEAKPELNYKDLCSLLKIASNNKYELPSDSVGEGVIDLSFLLENI